MTAHKTQQLLITPLNTFIEVVIVSRDNYPEISTTPFFNVTYYNLVYKNPCSLIFNNRFGVNVEKHLSLPKNAMPLFTRFR